MNITCFLKSKRNEKRKIQESRKGRNWESHKGYWVMVFLFYLCGAVGGDGGRA